MTSQQTETREADIHRVLYMIDRAEWYYHIAIILVDIAIWSTNSENDQFCIIIFISTERKKASDICWGLYETNDDMMFPHIWRTNIGRHLHIVPSLKKLHMLDFDCTWPRCDFDSVVINCSALKMAILTCCSLIYCMCLFQCCCMILSSWCHLGRYTRPLMSFSLATGQYPPTKGQPLDAAFRSLLLFALKVAEEKSTDTLNPLITGF